MRRKFDIGATLLLLSVWAHMALVSGQAAAQSTVRELAAREIVFDAENGLLSVDVGAVPLADVLRSIAEQAGAALTIDGDPGASVAQRFKGLPLELGIWRLVAGDTRLGMVIEYGPAASSSGARVPVKIAVYASAGSPIAETPPSRSAGSGDIGYDREARSERLAEVRDLEGSDDPTSAASLARILSESDYATVRRKAATALGKFGGNDTARTALIDALWDQDLRVRVAVFKSLANVGGDGAAQALGRVLSESEDALSRRAAAVALGALPGQDARTALERARSDVNPAVVEAVERALAQ